MNLVRTMRMVHFVASGMDSKDSLKLFLLGI